MHPPVTIERSFADSQRREVAELYDEAFGPKLGIAIPNKDVRLRILAEAFDPQHAFVAKSESRILGVAGFKTTKGSLTHGMTLSKLHFHLGWFAAARALAVLALFDRSLSPGQLLMDGIVVAPESRGAGVGSELLNQLKLFAAEQNCHAIRLDVIDSNPAARRLYERMGFVATKTQSFPYLRWLLGFTGATTLEFHLKTEA